MNEILFGSLLLTVIVLVLAIIVVLARSALMPVRAAVLTVNEQTELQTKTGQKLLSSLLENDILVPSACAGAGTCGLCRIKVEEGAPDTTPIEAGLFTKAELHDGMHLACQVMVRGDMKVQVPADIMSVETFSCQVVSSRSLTPLIREVVLQLPEGTEMELVAGAFVQITAPPFSLAYADLKVPDAHEDAWKSMRDLRVDSEGDVTRAYSVSDRPEDLAAGRLVLNVRLALPPPSAPDAPPGIVSSWLFGLSEGAEVSVSGPFGTFRAQDTEREMVFIGGGVGMAPLRAIIHEQLERVGTGRAMSFWYGARNEAELFYRQELDALAAKHANFNWTVALSDPAPSDNWTGSKGFVHSVVFKQHLQNHPTPEDCEYYLCGPPLMIRAVMAMLDELGVDRDHIFNDDFGV
ncbi:MAG: NADH:ubiquinone reductase (Na(+)-transporting) subunit F [Alphaproteobacteria bacterium]